MKVIVIDHFGGPEALVFKDLPEPEPKAGHAIVQVKALGLNHAESHMRKGKWPEYMPVTGLECVGSVTACPGGEFAAIMGGLGQLIPGTYAEYTSVPVLNLLGIETSLPWAAIPETNACVVNRLRHPGVKAWANFTHPWRYLSAPPGRLPSRRSYWSHRHSYLTLAGTLPTDAGDGCPCCQARGPGLGTRNRRFRLEVRCRSEFGRKLCPYREHDDRPSWSSFVPGRMAGWLGTHCGLQSNDSDGHWHPLQSLIQQGLGHIGLPLLDVPLQETVRRVEEGDWSAKPSHIYDFAHIHEAHRMFDSGPANGKLVLRM
ncbi:hypothetical protein HO173_002318 [Letharia columbiana]|uniref:Uncharacterized protein n=1 Tax=Letharia columbiana TaxID=112416 RepID=A0A8H6G3B0_9LECA|nr:uncharacterized protein HO173_002318 [Letharia columbiana]KAF6239772.1 hypothetical protein HO173_002318 [Letharia columbiana]